jgi:hypothetical protein
MGPDDILGNASRSKRTGAVNLSQNILAIAGTSSKQVHATDSGKDKDTLH